MEISERKRRGLEAEEKFKEWMDKHNIPYLYIKQDTQSFSNAFKGFFPGKRPDFLLMIPSFGVIFVDVKNKKISEHKTYPIDAEEIKKYSSMQRKFNINT